MWYECVWVTTDYFKSKTWYVLVGEHTEQHVADEYAQHEHWLSNVGQLEPVAYQVPLYQKKKKKMIWN